MIKSIIKGLLLLSALIIIMALAGEAFCRLVMPLDKKRDRYMATRNIFHMDEGNVRFDSELGYTIKPGLVSRFDNEEFRTTVATNSGGFRDDEESLKDPSILICGDSFGFGWGVDQSSCFDSYLEGSSGVKALNMGVPGYGTLQEFLALKRFAKNNDIYGKTIIFLFYPNDVIDTLGFGSGSISVDNGVLNYSGFNRHAFEDITKMYKTRPYRGIYQSSYLAYVLKNAGKDIKNKLRGKKKDRIQTTVIADENMKFKILSGVMEYVKMFSLRNNLKTIFVWIPSVRYYEDGKGKFGNDYEDTVYQRVKKIIDDSEFQFVDMSDSLGRNDYYRQDGHLKQSGHQKMAARVKEFLYGPKP